MTVLQKIVTGFLAALFLVIALPAAGGDPENLSDEPVVYVNEGGDFQITFPGGCGKLVTRANEPDLFGGEDWDDIIQVTHAYCDRYRKKGEGCSVTATFNLHDKDGSIAGPEQIILRVEDSLSKFGAKVVSQQVIKKDFGNDIIAEGVEVMARPEEGPGEIWIRGLLIEGDVYIFAAWNEQGGVWKNPDYITFFNSFQPWTE